MERFHTREVAGGTGSAGVSGRTGSAGGARSLDRGIANRKDFTGVACSWKEVPTQPLNNLSKPRMCQKHA